MIFLYFSCIPYPWLRIELQFGRPNMITHEAFGAIQGPERYLSIVWQNVSCCEYHKMIFYNTKIGAAKTQQL